MKRTWQERLLSRVIKVDGGCWLWTGPLGWEGYANFGGGVGHGLPKSTGVHRWSYLAHVGPIPEGLELDHLCNVRHCVNPAHLEPVTPDENKRRRSERQTHCKNGHAFTPENTHQGPACRVCRTCKRESTRRLRAARQSVSA